MRRAASAGAPPLESKVTKAIMVYLKSRDIWCFKVAGGPMQQRGVPDIVCCVNGAFVALEVKRPGLGRLTDLQALTIERIREAGGVAEVVTSVEEAAAVIEEVDGFAVQRLRDAADADVDATGFYSADGNGDHAGRPGDDVHCGGRGAVPPDGGFKDKIRQMAGCG